MAKRKMENGNKEKEILEEDNRPSFCTIVFSKKSNERLLLPSEFLKHISNELSDKATLKACSGCSRTAKVSNTWKGIYIEDGWQQFLKDNSLGKDEFLRISYEGNMCFSIQIFEMNGCERMNVRRTRTDHQSPPTSSKRPQDSTNVPHFKTHQNSASTTVKRPRGRPRKYPLPTANHHLSKSCEDDSGKSLISCQSNKPNGFIDGKGKEIKTEEDDDHRVHDLSKEDMAIDWKAAESFRSKYPYFTYSVQGRYQVYIPSSFSKEHLPFKKTVEVVLRNQKGESWVVTLVVARGRHSICRGWLHFMNDNKLELGDRCIFELVGRKEMKVHSIRTGPGR
ncbi:B3 domain-containing protein At5g18090 [Ziziphus jujuba]|uniref:B3 domain-containing protein At5g18090 n=2 Tax=Ziziphus jujuba TaxID=326968 RepID=A0ABM3IWV2_ZIZJJ|nr:B3 domain-containing protein At5g18090 [Ziziphus jujuba]